jgi:DNA polymerase-4
VQVGRRRRSIGSQRALGLRRLSLPDIDAALIGLIDRVCRRLRAAQRVCRTVVLRLRLNDFSRITRSHTLPRPSDDTETILDAARLLLAVATPLLHDGGCTLVGVSLTNLGNAHDPVQLELPFGARAIGRLDHAVDGVRERFGTAAITRGVLLGRDPGMTVPMLPD